MSNIEVLNSEEIPRKEREHLLEATMLQQEQVPCPVTHRFGPGTYIREVKIPKDALAVGHHQNFEHMNIFLSGRVTMFNDDGTFTELTAPMIFTSGPGRKIGYAHEDMVWLNVYPTEEQDVEKLESHYLTKSTAWTQSNEELQSRLKSLLLTTNNNADYELMLKAIGVNAATVKMHSENSTDLIDLPSGGYKIKVSKSNIEGSGLFATGNFEPGEIIAPSRINNKRTIAGRYTNHASEPNAKMVQSRGSDINLVAIKTITGCLGGFDGEEITVNYRDAYALTMKMGLEELSCQE